MQAINPQAVKKIMPISFKLLHDMLFILLFFFALALIAEGLLPGIIASHFGMSKFIVLILGNIFLITLSGRFLNIKSSSPLANKKMILTVSFLGILLILNGLLKMGWILNLFITLLTIGLAYLLFGLIFEEND